MKISENTPRIYVGTYGMYNSGSLYGKWFDLSAYTDTQECKYPKITDCLNTDKPTFCAFVNSPHKYISKHITLQQYKVHI